VALVSDESAPQHRVERSRPTRLRALADFYPDGILGASREGVVTILNAQGAALLGVDVEDAKGLPLSDVLRLLDQDGRTWLDVNRPFDAISITRGVPEQSWLNAFGDEVLPPDGRQGLREGAAQPVGQAQR
jgi:PAS domain-containing protein